MAHIQLFPKEFLDLQVEIRNHPPLVQQLKRCKDFAEWIGSVALYVDVILDAWYEIKDIVELCRLLHKKLIQKRGSLLVVTDRTTIDRSS